MTDVPATSVLHEGVHIRLAVQRPARGVVVLCLAGWDAGELGDAPMQELAKDLAGGDAIELFIDARAVKGASLDVSSDWAQWLRKNRTSFRRIRMLTGSPFIQMTAAFVQKFAELGELMQIDADPALFEAAIAQSCDSKAAE